MRLQESIPKRRIRIPGFKGQLMRKNLVRNRHGDLWNQGNKDNY